MAYKTRVASSNIEKCGQQQYNITKRSGRRRYIETEINPRVETWPSLNQTIAPRRAGFAYWRDWRWCLQSVVCWWRAR